MRELPIGPTDSLWALWREKISVCGIDRSGGAPVRRRRQTEQWDEKTECRNLTGAAGLGSRNADCLGGGCVLR
jgi:hypothetical protein